MVAQDEYIGAPGDDDQVVIRGNRGGFIGWADGYAFTKEAGDDFSATGIKEHNSFWAAQRDLKTLANLKERVANGETVLLKDANGAVYAVGSDASMFAGLVSTPTDIPSLGQYAPNNSLHGSVPAQTLNVPGASPLTGPVERINAGNYQILTDGTKVQILVKMDYQGSAATPEVVAKFNQGIEAGWTGQFGNYSVHTFVTQVADGPAFRPVVAPGEGRSNMNGPGLWYAAADGGTAAHEIGHGFGLPDRYEMWVQGNPPMPGYENNIMAVSGGVPSGADISAILTMARSRQKKVN